MTLNRRGFLGLLSKVAGLGMTMGVPGPWIEPIQKMLSLYLFVDQKGCGNHRTIQGAVDALPKDGGTIFIRRGVYTMESLVLNNVTLKGEGSYGCD